MVPEHNNPGRISRSLVEFAPPELARFRQLEAACEFFDHSDEALIQILHRAQELFGYLRDDVIEFLSDRLKMPASRVFGVVTFYSFFSTVPKGRHIIMVCTGTACYVRGAEEVLDAFKKELGIDVGQTTVDGMFSLTTARCIGACGLAPVAMIGEDVHSALTPEKVAGIVKEYR